MKTRKIISICLSFLMILTALPMAGISSFAATSGSFDYEILSDGTVEITGYNGYASSVTVPSEIAGRAVTSIGGYAFSSCTSLESISLPDSLFEIKCGAFFNCTSLKSIRIPDSVKYIGGQYQEAGVFYGCTSLSEIIIPDSVISVGNSYDYYDTAYYYNNWYDNTLYIGNHLIEVENWKDGDTIKEGTVSIAGFAFSYLYNIDSIVIPDSVKSICANAFVDCYSLQSIVIPESVEYIGEYAVGYRFAEDVPVDVFERLNGFTVYCYPNTEAERYAYNNGFGFVELSTSSSDDDFDYEKLYDGTVEITGYNGYASRLDIPSTLKGYTVTSIGIGAFKDCTSLTSVTIPDSVTNILYSAFLGCTSLESITIPDSVTWIQGNAFSGCTSLESVVIPDSVAIIRFNAFYNCTSLKSITIPNSVISIEGGAFEYCTSLESITIPDSVTSIGRWAFYNTAYYNNAENWEDGVLYIGKHLVATDTEYDWETEICTTTVPENYKIKDGTLTVTEWAFLGCTLLKSITIPDSVTSIGACAFEYCTSLESITIPDSVTSIGDWSFCVCTSLKSITIPDSVTSIGLSVFYDTAYYNNLDNWENGVLYIGKHLVATDTEYRSESGPGTTTVPENYKIKDGTLTIADYAFYNCISLESITIPDSVTNIGEWAFGYYFNDETEEYEKISGITIYGYTGTEAERYARDNEFTFIALEAVEYTQISGDVNGDGKISVVDATFILRDLANILHLTDEDKAAADVNGDGKVTVVDAKWILQAVAGIRDLVEIMPEPEPEPDPEPEETSLSSEEAVEIFMNNKDMWMLCDDGEYVMYDYGYTFLDLDMDGVLELITSESWGNVRETENAYYKINTENNSIFKIEQSDESKNFEFTEMGRYNNYGIDVLYLLKQGDSYKYYGFDVYNPYGSGMDSMLIYGTMYMNSGKICNNELFVTDEYREHAYGDGTGFFGYYDNYGNYYDIDENTYFSMIDEFMSEYDNLNLSWKFINGKDFEATVDVYEQAEMLLEAYNAFSYTA